MAGVQAAIQSGLDLTPDAAAGTLPRDPELEPLGPRLQDHAGGVRKPDRGGLFGAIGFWIFQESNPHVAAPIGR